MNTTEFLDEFQALLASDPAQVHEVGHDTALWFVVDGIRYCPITYTAHRKQIMPHRDWRLSEWREAGGLLGMEKSAVENIADVADYTARKAGTRLDGTQIDPETHRKLRRRLQARIRKAMAARKGGRP